MWTYPTIDFAAGELVADHIPFTDVSFSGSMTGGGSMSGTIDNGFPLLSADMRNHATRFVTFPCRDGKPFGFYVWVTGPAQDLSSTTQQIQMVSGDDIFKRRPIMDDLVFTGKEQLDIARDLLRYGMGASTLFTDTPVTPDATWRAWAGIPWLRLHPGVTGVTRDRTKVVDGQEDDGYRRKGHKAVGDAVAEMADNLDGFGYQFMPGVDADGLFVLVQWGSPILGSIPEYADRCVFEYPGGNIVKGSYGWDAADYANRVEVIGGEAEGIGRVGVAQWNAQLAAGYPLRVKTISMSSVTDQATLDAKAAAELVASGIQDGYTIELDGTKPPVLGTYDIGDHVTLRIQRAGAPTVDERVVRITGWSISVDDSGLSESVVPVLGERAW